MRKLFLLYIFIWMCGHYCSGQDHKVDSLKQILKTDIEGTKRVDVLIELFNVLRYSDLEEAKKYMEKGGILSAEIKYIKGIAKNKHQQGVYYFHRGDFSLSLEMANQTIQYLSEVEDDFEKEDYNEFIFVARELKSSDLDKLGKKEKGLLFRYETINFLNENYDKDSNLFIENMTYTYLNMAVGYIDLNDSLALVYLKKAKPYAKKNGNLSLIGFGLLSEYVASNNLEKKIEYLNPILDSAIYYFQEDNNKIQLQEAYMNKCALLEENDFFDDAKVYCEKANELNEVTNNKYMQTHILENFGYIAMSEKYFSKANNFFKDAFDLSKDIQTDLHSIRILKNYSFSFDSLGDYNMASRYKGILLDSLENYFDRELSQQFAEAEAKFQNTEKEKQIVQQALEIAKQKNNRNRALLGGILTLLAATGIYFWYYIIQNRKKRQAELALQKQIVEAEKLRELDTLKSNFFANISHEFRTPLTLILGPLKDMIDGSFGGNRQTYYRMMERNGNRLLELINQLLDLSRLESGEMLLNAQENDIAQYTKALAYSFESLAESKEINFLVQVPEDEIFAYLDLDKYEKIITNILTNAFKFTPENGAISLSLAQGNDKIEVRVSDSGIGISAKELPLIFNRFYQVDSSSTRGKSGSGIGLALTKELVNLHGGNIHVESEEGQGSVFIISFPLGKSHLSPDQITVVAQSTPIAKKKTVEKEHLKNLPLVKSNQPIVLIVEDNSDVRLFIKDKIKGDYQVLEAENGKIGLELANLHIPDLIISDVMMPEMDGIEFSKHIKTSEPTSHIPIIMLTAKADISDKIEGLETGVDDYLTKPFNGAELLVRMNNLIVQRRKLREKFSAGTLKLKEVAVTSVDEVFLTKLFESIETNLEDDRFGIEELAADMYMGRRQLLRKTKALINQTPNKLLRTLRLKRAKELLEKGAGNVSEVSIQTGFNSLSHFSKCFKDEFGILPSEV